MSSSFDRRIEHDSLGSVEVRNEHLWGAQTQRALSNFPHDDSERMPAALLRAFGVLKQVAAEVNVELGVLDPTLGGAITQAARELAAGQLDEHFPLAVWQSGSGTQTHMNVNEVLANRANELLGGPRGAKSPVHPNDHCNRGQSTNDSFPTAMHIAVVLRLERELLPALGGLLATLRGKAAELQDVVKIGRTHGMDATPLTVGQEVSAWARQVELGVQRLQSVRPRLLELAQGGTAVGTGLNAAPGFAVAFAARAAALTGLDFVPAANPFEALAAHDALVELSGALNTVAGSLFKIANDVRLLASGPRAGLGELRLPANEPGSSIMPGKVNPTQAEALAMVCAHVMGAHVSVTLAGASGSLQLNTYKPLIAHAVLRSLRLMVAAVRSFDRRCVAGLEVDRAQVARHVEASLMLVTALTPRIGYDEAARIAHHAHLEGTTLRQAAVALGVLSADDFDALVKPAQMTCPSAPLGPA